VIGGWLVKVLVGIAVIGFAVVELGSPFIARAQADDAAHEVANEAAFRLRDSNTQQTLDDTCASEAAEQDVTVVSCEVNEQRDVVVRVRKEARSFLLAKFEPFEKWYKAEATATATPK
jgi:hypothetical protein